MHNGKYLLKMSHTHKILSLNEKNLRIFCSEKPGIWILNRRWNILQGLADEGRNYATAMAVLFWRQQMQNLCGQSRQRVKLCYNYGHFPWETANAEPIFADRVCRGSNCTTTMSTFLGRQQMQNPSLQTEHAEGQIALQLWPLSLGGSKCRVHLCRQSRWWVKLCCICGHFLLEVAPDVNRVDVGDEHQYQQNHVDLKHLNHNTLRNIVCR